MARLVIQVIGWLIGIPLEILVIVALLRGGYRRNPLIFLYMAVMFVTTLVGLPFTIQSSLTGSEAAKRLAAVLYWVNEVFLQVLIFAIVISLIDQAISTSRNRGKMRAALVAGAVLFAGTSLLIHYSPPPVKIGEWMTPWMADLGLCTTILDLALWMILIASRKSDRRLLMISGGLGMQFTGAVIGGQLGKMAIPHRVVALALTGQAVSVAAGLLCLYVWWQTFRSASDRAPEPGRK